MKPELPNEFVIFDTEYTAWEGSWQRGWDRPNEEKELVQLGAIRVRNFEEVDALLQYVKPVINPELSQYFIDLTGVTQSDVDDKGVSFTEAYQEFMQWRNGLPTFSYGPDVNILVIGHELAKTKEVVPVEEFHDIREYFNAVSINTDNYMSSTIPEAFGLTPPSAAHDALNDARSILMALKAMYTSR